MEMCVIALCNLVPIMEDEYRGNTVDTSEIICCDHGTLRDELKYWQMRMTIQDREMRHMYTCILAKLRFI